MYFINTKIIALRTDGPSISPEGCGVNKRKALTWPSDTIGSTPARITGDTGSNPGPSKIFLN